MQRFGVALLGANLLVTYLIVVLTLAVVLFVPALTLGSLAAYLLVVPALTIVLFVIV